MKKRVSVFLNFIAFNILFFALYLNFIHKDAIAAPAFQQQMHSSIETSISHTKKVVEDGASSTPVSGEKTLVSKEDKSF